MKNTIAWTIASLAVFSLVLLIIIFGTKGSEAFAQHPLYGTAIIALVVILVRKIIRAHKKHVLENN